MFPSRHIYEINSSYPSYLLPTYIYSVVSFYTKVYADGQTLAAQDRLALTFRKNQEHYERGA